jgi:hypothetical protein
MNAFTRRVCKLEKQFSPLVDEEPLGRLWAGLEAGRRRVAEAPARGELEPADHTPLDLSLGPHTRTEILAAGRRRAALAPCSSTFCDVPAV